MAEVVAEARSSARTAPTAKQATAQQREREVHERKRCNSAPVNSRRSKR